ncbi:unnamed protein product [Victoria cruziana]
MGVTSTSIFVLLLSLLMLHISGGRADPDMLQDICVADLASPVKLNGYPCKESSMVTANDFFFAGLKAAAAVNSSVGSTVTPATVQKIPGLNTLGVSMGRVDYAVGGINPPHKHPRATEIAFVLEGTLRVGFITTANVLISKTIAEGEVFVFPKGLVHFQQNVGDTPAAAVAAFDSQLPGTQYIAATLFASSPALPDEVLAKAFHISTEEVEKIRDRFAAN